MVDRLSKIEIILCILILFICQSSSNLRRRTYKSSRPVWDSGNSNPGGVPVASHGGYIPAPTPKPQVRTRTETRIVSDGNGIRQTRIISSGGSFPQTVGGSSRRVIISSSGTGASRDAMMEQMRKMIKEQHDRIRSEGGNGKFTITSHTSHIIQGAPQVVQGPAPAPQPKPYKSTKPLTPSKFTPQEQATLLRYHNDVRQHLDPPPKVMEQMKWSDVLAGKAQEYAEKCEWRHSDKSTRKDQLGYSFVGENLYVSTEYSVTKSVKSWADEKAFYDFWANTCVPGEQCGHYTQMIWATTNMVGCGIHFCKTVAFWRRGDAYYVVCNYGPGGNLNGARPYEAKTSRSSNTVQSVNGWGSQTIRKTDQKTWNQQTGTSRDVQNNGNLGSNLNSDHFGTPTNTNGNWNNVNYGTITNNGDNNIGNKWNNNGNYGNPTNTHNNWSNGNDRNYGATINTHNSRNNGNIGNTHHSGTIGDIVNKNNNLHIGHATHTGNKRKSVHSSRHHMSHGTHSQHNEGTLISHSRGSSKMSRKRGGKKKGRSRRRRR